MWLGLSILGWIMMPIIAGQGVQPQDVPSLAAWAMGSNRCTSLRTVSPGSVWFPQAASAHSELIGAIGRLAWGATAASCLPTPADRSRTRGHRRAEGVVRLHHAFVDLLLSYGYALVGVTAVVLLIRMAWRRTSWEQQQKVKGRRSGGARNILRRIGRVIFAGYVIGTAGVFAVLPIPFLIAFALFDRLLLRRSSDTRRLAEYAPSIRRHRRALLEARIPKDDDAKDPDTSKEASGPADAMRAPETTTVDGFPAAWAGSWWRSTLADRSGRHPAWAPDGVWRRPVILNQIRWIGHDGRPYFLQRLGLNIAAFVGSCVIIGFFFGLMYEHLRGEFGLRKGLGSAR